jgi:hypothetical protein
MDAADAVEKADAAQVFAQHLVALWDAVGRPTTRRLEEISRSRHGKSKERVKRTTLDDHFRAKRQKIPSWPMVLELLEICREIAQSDGYGDLELGTNNEWLDVWRVARRGVITDPPGQLPHAEILSTRARRPSAITPTPSPEGETQAKRQPLQEEHPTAVSRPDPAPQALTDERRGAAGDKPEQSDPPPRRADRQPARATPSDQRHAYIFHAPDLGEEGGWITVIEWLHQVGDHVDPDEVLVRVRTDNMFDLDLKVPRAGVLGQIFVPEEGEVAAGHPLCAVD